MKNLVLLFLIVILTLFISGCGENQHPIENTDMLINDSLEDEIFVVDITTGTGGERECWFDSQCQDGEGCIDNRCMAPTDVSECESIERDLNKHTCIKYIAVKNNDAQTCRNIVTSAMGYSSVEMDCYAEIAIANNDDSVCAILVEVKGAQYGADCYTRFAIQKSSSESCDKITDSRKNEECVRRLDVIEKYPELGKDNLMYETWPSIARRTNNQDYCEYTTSTFDKRDCDAYFNEDQ